MNIYNKMNQENNFLYRTNADIRWERGIQRDT